MPYWDQEGQGIVVDDTGAEVYRPSGKIQEASKVFAKALMDPLFQKGWQRRTDVLVNIINESGRLPSYNFTRDGSIMRTISR